MKMKKINCSFLFLILLHMTKGSRIRLCINTGNNDKLQPQCVYCPARQLNKILELCTGSSEYNTLVNITYQQARCLINICNRNPTHVTASDQFIETVNTKTPSSNNKFTRPNKQQLVNHHTMNTAEINNNLDNQNLDDGLSNNELSNGLSSLTSTNDAMLNEQQQNEINFKPNDHHTNWMMQTSVPSAISNNKFIAFKRKPFRLWPFFFG